MVFFKKIPVIKKDNFGHISQLPQIYAGFNISTAAIWRAVGDDIASEVWWQAPDNSSVLLLHLKQGVCECVVLLTKNTYYDCNCARQGYCYGGGAPKESDAAVTWLAGKQTGASKHTSTRHSMVLNGCDHTAFDPYILSALRAWENSPNKTFVARHSSLERYAAAVRAELPPKAPPHATRPAPPPTPMFPAYQFRFDFFLKKIYFCQLKLIYILFQYIYYSFKQNTTSQNQMYWREWLHGRMHGKNQSNEKNSTSAASTTTLTPAPVTPAPTPVPPLIYTKHGELRHEVADVQRFYIVFRF